MGKQPTMGQKKTKEAIAKAAAASRKTSKKKWSKGKVKEKLNNAVLLDPKQFKDVEKELPKMKLITISTVADRFKVAGSVARNLIRYFYEKKQVGPLDFQHQQLPLFRGLVVKEKTEGEEAGKKDQKKGGAGRKGKATEEAPKEEAPAETTETA